MVTQSTTKSVNFDSEYDPYRGVISSIRIVDGVVKAGDKIRMMATGKVRSNRSWNYTPKQLPVDN